MPRTIAIGDIHGCSTALARLIERVAPQPDDVIVPLGDFVDRGIDSKGVIEQLIALANRCRLVPILGNHEEMMLGAREGWSDFRFWMNCGGLACLDSYGSTGRIDLIPRSHFTFPGILPDVLRDRAALLRPRQLQTGGAARPLGHPNAAVAVVAGLRSAVTALLRQGRHRRPHAAARSLGSRLLEVPRHRLLLRWLANGVGRGQRPVVAGG